MEKVKEGREGCSVLAATSTHVCGRQNTSALPEQQVTSSAQVRSANPHLRGRAEISVCLFAEGYKPRRSIIFASWSAGDYGAVGATEWLEVLVLQTVV